jgi:hypothetical protein
MTMMDHVMSEVLLKSAASSSGYLDVAIYYLYYIDSSAGIDDL